MLSRSRDVQGVVHVTMRVPRGSQPHCALIWYDLCALLCTFATRWICGIVCVICTLMPNPTVDMYDSAQEKHDLSDLSTYNCAKGGDTLFIIQNNFCVKPVYPANKKKIDKPGFTCGAREHLAERPSSNICT